MKRMDGYFWDELALEREIPQPEHGEEERRES